MRLPDRKSLVTQAVEYIQGKIEAGVFSGNMPTEHELSAQLLVSRNTLRAAFARLEAEKWIGPARQGTRRKVLKFFPKEGGEAPFKIACLTYAELEQMRPHDLAMLEAIRTVAQPLNGSLTVFPSSTIPGGETGNSLELLVRQTGADVWLLFRAPAQTQRWFSDMAIPAILLGTAVENLTIHCIDVDWRQVAREAVQRLVQAGHRRILYAGPRERLEGVRLSEMGFTEAIGQAGNGVSGMIVHQEARGARREAFVDELKGMFMQAERPSAVITHRAGQTMTLLGVLNDMRLRVGEDVSLMTLDYDELFSEFRPEISGFRARRSDHAPRIFNLLTLIKNRARPEILRDLFLPEFVQGETVRPPR